MRKSTRITSKYVSSWDEYTVEFDEILFHPKEQCLAREMTRNRYLLATKWNSILSISKYRIDLNKIINRVETYSHTSRSATIVGCDRAFEYIVVFFGSSLWTANWSTASGSVNQESKFGYRMKQKEYKKIILSSLYHFSSFRWYLCQTRIDIHFFLWERKIFLNSYRSKSDISVTENVWFLSNR